MNRLSVIIQFFNRRKNVRPIAEALSCLERAEVIVCDDGSIDGSHEEWLKRVPTGGVVIRSNDLHEIRAYDRAASLTRGDVLCFLQDDDVPPATAEWVETALRLFEKYPRLGILGGFRGYEFNVNANNPSVARIETRIDHPVFMEPDLQVPFMFVEAVNLTPLFVRQAAYRQTGYDYQFSRVGESGILFDQEICLHAWLRGWHVGLYSAPFERRVGGRGTLIYSKESRERNFEINLRLIGNAYGDRLAAFKRQADALNLEWLTTK